MPSIGSRTRSLSFFYGWVIVAAVMVSGAFSTGVSIFGFSVFVTPMEAELGWARATFFLALTIRALLGGFLGPFLGPLQDTKNGPRLLMLFSSLLLGGSLIGLKFVHSPWQFYMLFGVLGALSFSSGGPLLGTAVLPKWFIRKRGRAMGIASMGSAMGPLLFPFSLQIAINTFGWRDAWMILGFASLALMVPLALLVKRQPEDMGLYPDGLDRPPSTFKSDSSGIVVREDRSMTRQEAIRTRSFWFILLSGGLAGVGLSGFHSNLLPHYREVGIAVGTATMAIAVHGFFSLVSRVIWGFLGERVPVRRLMVFQTVLTGLSILILLNMRNLPMLFFFAVVQGTSLSGHFILLPLLIANYYGRAHLGAVNGFMRPFMTMTNAASPLLLAALYDMQNSYRLAFYLVTVAWIMAGIAILPAKPPRATPEPSAAPKPGP